MSDQTSWIDNAGVPLETTSFFGIERPSPLALCDRCDKQVGRAGQCITDGAWHRHGMSHVFTDDGLELLWLCDGCRLAVRGSK